MKVLGIETSCDETGVAIYCSDQGLLAHKLFSQIALHSEFGGVVPELASRDHVRYLLPLITELLQQYDLNGEDLDGVAYTAGPGLVGALMVGSAVGRSLALSWGIPAIGVHHMEAHLMAAFLEDNQPEYPFVSLLVSGGHTMLVEVSAFGQYQLLGSSVDDAVGEAFDKTAKLLGLSYPGGPALAELAQQGREGEFTFPRPMVNRPGLDFSFSGLKTHVLQTVEKVDLDQQVKADIAYAFEQAVAQTLVIKSKRALEQTGLSRLVAVGGVAANLTLRNQLNEMVSSRGGHVFYPRQEFCTDNGAMVAYVGCERLRRGEQDDLRIRVSPRWSLEDI